MFWRRWLQVKLWISPIDIARVARHVDARWLEPQGDIGGARALIYRVDERIAGEWHALDIERLTANDRNAGSRRVIAHGESPRMPCPPSVLTVMPLIEQSTEMNW